MKIKVKISEDNIAKGKIKSPGFCPVKLALKPLIKHNVEIYVDYGLIYLESETAVVVKMPSKMLKFIRKFDSHATATKKKKVKPCSFNLKIPKKFMEK